ncbi:MAG: hypothetical protein AAFZ18_16450 [Myxococcota bacterium]
MEPVDGPVKVQAPLPRRNRPRPVGVATPGQRRQDTIDVLSARIALSGYRLTTNGQDLIFSEQRNAEGELVAVPGDRDIELLRGRATLDYSRIGGSEFSTRLDVEYRPRLNGEGRFDNQRLNALYVAWGLTEVHRPQGPDFGVAVGRVQVREAGRAQADGLAVRWRPLPELRLGAFGGFTGNPYGYNWARQAPETFSTDWITGGLFARWSGRRVQVSISGVLTAANVPRPAPDPGPFDRIYVHADASWQPLPNLSVFGTAFLDLLPSGQLVQNGEISASWRPQPLELTLAVGRFSTILYEISTGYSFTVDPSRNLYGAAPNNLPIVDANGNAVVPFDGAQLAAVYTQVRASAGYRLFKPLEVFVRLNALIRDTSAAEDAIAPLEGEVPLAPTASFANTRLLPALGARFSDPDLLDADGQLTLVVDEQSQADAVAQLGIGRGLFGFYLRADARYLMGDIDALDGGVELSWAAPQIWLPGRLQMRGAFRYFREDLAIARPDVGQVGVLGADDVLPVIPVQESFLGFVGVEWRL